MDSQSTPCNGAKLSETKERNDRLSREWEQSREDRRDTTDSLRPKDKNRERLSTTFDIPDHLVVQSGSKTWRYVEGAREYVHAEVNPPEITDDLVRGLIGAKDTESRLRSLAAALANSEPIVVRQKKLEAMLVFLQSVLTATQDTLRRLRKTETKTRHYERVENSKCEERSLKNLSLSQWAQLFVVGFWLVLLGGGVSAEVLIGEFNVIRAEMEGATSKIAICIAFLPFMGTFAALKWLDPADIDRERGGFYKWLTRLTIITTPLAMYLFASKLDALLETKYAVNGASDGPAFTWVVWTIQISFALSIYLTALKLSDAWYAFLGYEVIETSEYGKVWQAIRAELNEQCSAIELGGDISGALAARSARERTTFERLRGVYDQLVKDDASQKELAEAEAQAAANTARANALRNPNLKPGGDNGFSA